MTDSEWTAEEIDFIKQSNNTIQRVVVAEEEYKPSEITKRCAQERVEFLSKVNGPLRDLYIKLEDRKKQLQDCMSLEILTDYIGIVINNFRDELVSNTIAILADGRNSQTKLSTEVHQIQNEIKQLEASVPEPASSVEPPELSEDSLETISE